jgi:xylan 1,4-beta-xylosidase
MKVPEPGATFRMSEPGGNQHGAVPLHQGGIVDLPNGDWWGFSMMDFRSVGRTTALSPVTWQDGWPYFGLPGNLGRTPRTWFKPAIAPHALAAPKPGEGGPYERSDDFTGPKLLPVWQWNHNPVKAKWSLTAKPGSLRLHTLPASQFLWAKNTLTQRAIGPVSVATAELDASGLQVGDTAGLALVNMPFATLGVVRTETGFVLRLYDQFTNETLDQPLASPRVWLRATGDYDEDFAHFSYSTDGGHADFASFRVDEPLADRSRNIPLGKVVTFTNLANGSAVWANPHGMLHSAQPGSKQAMGAQSRFRVHDRGQGRVSLEAMDGSGWLTVVGAGLSADVRPMKQETAASLFMWQDMLRDRQCMLLSLKTNRFVGLDPTTGEPYGADWPGTTPTRKDGTVLVWTEVN